jgi:hypothetical protein
MPVEVAEAVTVKLILLQAERSLHPMHLVHMVEVQDEATHQVAPQLLKIQVAVVVVDIADLQAVVAQHKEDQALLA